MISDRQEEETVSDARMYYLFTGIGLLMMILVVTGVVCVCKIKRNKSSSKDACEDVASKKQKLLSPKISISRIMDANVDLPEQEEFDSLFKYEDNITSRLTTYQGRRNNDKTGLNQNKNILPYDHNRIQLTNPIQGSDYINASKIKKVCDDPSYDEIIYSSLVQTYQIDFIVGQKETSITLSRHLQMMHEQKINVAIHITGGKPVRNLKVGRVDSFNHMKRKTVMNMPMSETLIAYRYEIFDTTSSYTQYKTNVTFFEIAEVKWDDTTLSGQTRNFVSDLTLIRKHLAKKSNSLKMLITDDDAGVSGAALFLALYEILENVDASLDENNLVKPSADDINVFEVVNRLRKDRMNMVDTLSTYQFLHLCLAEYCQNKTVFDKMEPKSLNADLDITKRSATKIKPKMQNVATLYL